MKLKVCFSSRTNLLWLHTSFAFMYLLLTVYSMRRHTSKMHYKEDDLVGPTSLVLRSVFTLHLMVSFQFCLFLAEISG